MRKNIVILMMAITLSASAKKYVSSSPWPAKGYKLSTWITPLEYTAIEVQRFEKTDVFYLKLVPLGAKNGEFCFLPISYEVADSILMFTCTDEYLPKKAERKQWIREFLKATGIQQPMNQLLCILEEVRCQRGMAQLLQPAWSRPENGRQAQAGISRRYDGLHAGSPLRSSHHGCRCRQQDAIRQDCDNRRLLTSCFLLYGHLVITEELVFMNQLLT